MKKSTPTNAPAGCYPMTHGRPVPNGIVGKKGQLVSRAELARRRRIYASIAGIIRRTDATMKKVRNSGMRRKGGRR